MNLETELRKALEPVMHWYQSDEGSTRELMDIVRDVVADLQRDRADAHASGRGTGAPAVGSTGAVVGNPHNFTSKMKHKYPIGTWVRFYQNGVLVIGVVEYLPDKAPGDWCCGYATSAGVVGELSILEARPPLEK